MSARVMEDCPLVLRPRQLVELRCDAIDNSFGPAALGCRFDFTLLFEETILFIGPSVLFLLFAVLRLWQLRKERAKVRHTFLHVAKVVITLAYLALQLALLVLWTRSGISRTKTSVPAAVFGLLDAIVISGLSFLEHSHSFRPSTLLQVYLLVSLLFDAARARSLWLISSYGSIASVFIIAVIVKLWIAIFEAIEKRRLLKEDYRSLAVESTSGVFNISVFWWLNRLLVTGTQSILSLADLEEVKQNFRSEVVQQSLEEAWTVAVKKRRHAFLFAVLKTFRWQIIAGVFPRLCMTAFNFTQPFLMNRLLNYLSDKNAKSKKNDGYGLIGAYGLVFLGIAVSTGRYSFKMSQATVLLRGSLTSIIYSKALNMDLQAVDDSNANTLMSVDVERICMVSQEMHQSWASLVELALAIFLLKRQLGVACLMPVILALGCTFGSMLLSGRIGGAQGTWLAATQRRLRATESLLASIKSAKMMGLTTRLSKLIGELRIEEIMASLGFRRLLVGSVVLSEVTNIMAPVLTFSLFTIIAKVKHQQSLLVSQAFTSLTVLSLIGTPIVMFVQIVPMLFATTASFQRIQDFLSSNQNSQSQQSVSLSKSASENGIQVGSSDNKNDPSFELYDLRGDTSTLSVTNGTFGWSSGDPVLQNINLNVLRRNFVAVVGPVGSGKSTLLRALLGELPMSEGVVKRPSRLAFCDQNAWITNTTLRANILGPREFDGQWYKTVIHACCLKDDLKSFPGGDEFHLGSRGLALSGGQKTRIAIARALYAREKVALFDDVLTGLDAKTEEVVFQRVFGPSGILRQQGTTVVLVTNRLRRLDAFDHIVALDKGGTIIEQSSPEKLQAHEDYINDVLSQQDATEAHEEAQNKGLEEVSTAEEVSVAEMEDPNDADRKTGDLVIYKYFFNSSGWLNAAFAFAMSCANAFCVVYSTIWLQHWAQNNTNGSDRVLDKYPIVYALLGVFALTTQAIFCRHVLIIMIPKSGKVLHKTVLTTMLNTPLSFFTKTDAGVTMNRFSQDMQLVDSHIQSSLVNTIEGFVTVLFRIIVVCVTAKYTSATLPFSILVIYLVQKYYLRTSRQLRLLDIEAKAPLYSHFLETLSGLATIRAYGWQNSFEARTHTLLDTSQKPFYLLTCIQRWLTFVLDCLTGILGLLIVILAVTLYGKGGMSPGETGVALINVVSFNQALAMLIISWTQLETSIGGVSRIRAFERNTKSEVRQAVRPDPAASWPEEGAIEMKNVTAAYDLKSPSVLKDVSLSISAGQRIGICGRTGSGKSSFILSILQMLELQSGSITIDGTDLSSISRETTRTRLITVPQDFMILDEPIRLALDPTGQYSDETIIDALTKVQIWKLLEQKEGLGTMGSELTVSHGERQLFALARAMMATGSIVIIDEACSSVDATTNVLMQQLIRSEFKGRTVLAVEHNMANILDYHRVIVLDKGEIIEQGRPEQLLEQESAFRTLYKSSAR